MSARYADLYKFPYSGYKTRLHIFWKLIVHLKGIWGHEAAAAEGVYIWGGSGGQKDNYIHMKSRTTAYHPHGDGVVGKFNRTLLQLPRTYVTR